jgi:hypothetical protein
MDRFPIIVTLGAAVLGRVAGEMIMSDPFVVHFFGGHPSRLLDYSVQLILAIGVVAAAKAWVRDRVPRGKTVVAESEE